MNYVMCFISLMNEYICLQHVNTPHIVLLPIHYFSPYYYYSERLHKMYTILKDYIGLKHVHNQHIITTINMYYYSSQGIRLFSTGTTSSPSNSHAILLFLMGRLFLLIYIFISLFPVFNMYQ